MPVVKIIISRSAVINLGDYENTKVHVGVEYELQGKTPLEAYEKATEELNTLFIEEVAQALEGVSDYRQRGWYKRLGIPMPAQPTDYGYDTPEEIQTEGVPEDSIQWEVDGTPPEEEATPTYPIEEDNSF